MSELIAVSSVLASAGENSLTFFCKGCDMPHTIKIGEGPGPRWGWNGNTEKPTFTPSVLAKGVLHVTDEEHAILMGGGHVEPRPFVCHSFITDGRIQYLGDSTHALANQTVDLADWQSNWDAW